ncbi:hypothetical protein ACSFBX_15240 [Variovorax sp. RB2P76]|uniref:hypothetical protein n=1 Tax=Variovorax sp. RB2P76 TaxID=3443736 RepID=UPI003F4758A3
MKCDIVEVGKRRDGGYRYWCVAHHANATAKYGVPADQCVAANDSEITEAQTLHLDPAAYPGGVALWGAVPAVFDTTDLPMDRGIHVHARERPMAKKSRDETFRRVFVPLQLDLFSQEWIAVDELDAINYMVSSVFSFPMKYISCGKCGFPHLDRDWFAVHLHSKHQCHGCGRQFSDIERGIGNPASALRSLNPITAPPPIKSDRKISIKQASYPRGMQIWGSNSAILWTSMQPEKIGIHVHGYDEQGLVLDGTFAEVEIDGITLIEDHIRVYMAQMAMPHLRERIVHLQCPSCKKSHFDTGSEAFTPHIEHTCEYCGAWFTAPTQLKKTIGNPFIRSRMDLTKFAANPVRQDFLSFRPETI